MSFVFFMIIISFLHFFKSFVSDLYIQAPASLWPVTRDKRIRLWMDGWMYTFSVSYGRGLGLLNILEHVAFQKWHSRTYDILEQSPLMAWAYVGQATL